MARAILSLFIVLTQVPLFAMSTRRLDMQAIEHWVRVSSAWTRTPDSNAPFFGANCAGASLLGLGLVQGLKFVSSTVMDEEILPKCFVEVSDPEPGDIAAFRLPSGESFHFNLFMGNGRSFNKMDIQAKFEFIETTNPFSCIDQDGKKKKHCTLYRYKGGPTCESVAN